MGTFARVSVALLTFAACTATTGCGSKSEETGPKTEALPATCEPTTPGCPGYASPEEVDELRELVRTYVDAGDDAKAEETLSAILAKPAATVARVTELLAEPTPRGKAKTGHLTDVPFKVGSKSSDYSMWVPTTYDPSTPYPLVVCLHGAFFSGSEYVDKWQPRLGEKYILACPTSGDWWTLPSEAFVFGLIDEVVRKYNIDPNRIFLSGMSDGGTGTFIFGAHHPDRFAGVSPMAAGFGLFEFLVNFTATPVYYIHGKEDQMMPIALGRKVVQTLKSFGVDVTFREHDEVSPEAGGHFFPRNELPALINWMDATHRNPYPKHIHYLRDGAHSGRVFWSDIEEVGAIDTIAWDDESYHEKKHTYAELDATITDNRIEVTTKSIGAFRILLNDQLVDLSKPVEIVTNGVTSFSGMVERSVETLLREARVRNDRMMLFSAAASVTVP